MYSEIEEKFIEETKTRLFQIALVFLGILATICYSFAFYDWIMSHLFLAILILLSLLFIIMYISLLVYLAKEKNDIKVTNFLNVPYIVETYKYTVHEKDIKTLTKILIDNNIKSRDDIKEILSHYRALLPKKIKANSAWLSVSAFAVSVVSIVLNDAFLTSCAYDEYIMFATVMFCIILSCYAVYWISNAFIMHIFGKGELYKRLELSISEIYINTPDEETKVLKKTSLRKHKRIFN